MVVCMVKENQQETTDQDAENRIAQVEEKYVRLQAEFANYKRRMDEQVASSAERGKQQVLKAVVNVLDDFTLALQNNDNPKEFHKGMEMIYAKLMSTGEDLGLKRIETVGVKFHPSKHEALLTEDSDRPDQEIIEELQAGYEFNGITLRTAKVKVSKNNEVK